MSVRKRSFLEMKLGRNVTDLIYFRMWKVNNAAVMTELRKRVCPSVATGTVFFSFKPPYEQSYRYCYRHINHHVYDDAVYNLKGGIAAHLPRNYWFVKELY